jgi:hypothetical protein
MVSDTPNDESDDGRYDKDANPARSRLLSGTGVVAFRQ